MMFVNNWLEYSQETGLMILIPVLQTKTSLSIKHVLQPEYTKNISPYRLNFLGFSKQFNKTKIVFECLAMIKLSVLCLHIYNSYL